MKRKDSKPTQFERGYRILQYLKKNTDRRHPARQIDLRKNPKLHELMGSQDTYNDLIHSMARTLNIDEEEQLLPEEEWQLVFDSFNREYGSVSFDDSEDDEYDEEDEYDGGDDGWDDEDDTACGPPKKPKSNRIRNLYYRHVFSQDEVDALIEGIWFSKTLSEKSGAA